MVLLPINQQGLGDIICSGTPENVGPVVHGDVVHCMLNGFPDLVIKSV